MIAGTFLSPAIVAARNLRSPATMRYLPLGSLTSSRGCSTPYTEMDVAISFRLSSVNVLRG